MTLSTKVDIPFIAGCVIAFAVACLATAYTMIAVIGWYLFNCKNASIQCSAAKGLIDYWWLGFIPAVLVATVFLRRAYDRRQFRRSSQA